MSEQDDFPERFRRDRREHGGAPQRLDDDQLAHLTEEERVAAGLDAYDPDEVPPATDTPPDPEDITLNEDWQEERAEFRRQEGTTDRPFEVHVISMDAYSVDGVRRLEDQGVTDAIVGFRWPYQVGPDTEPLAEKIAKLRRFADTVIAKVT